MKKTISTAILISLSTLALWANTLEPVSAAQEFTHILVTVNAADTFDNHENFDALTQEEILQDLQNEIQSLAKKKPYIPLDIPGSERPEVEKIRNQILKSPKWSKRLYDDLERAQDYRIFVRKAVMDAELPLVLEYLPMVESNYNPSARSKSGAIGLWQFMENSVSNFLVLNDFVDERYDPWKETDAAIKKLQENYRFFKDWPLALGAYNCGLGAMNRALKKSPVKDFWYLSSHGYISRQTADYVPKLLAIADLAINSEYYGIDLPDHHEEFEILVNEKEGNFDYIKVKKAYSINQLAQEMKMDTTVLKRLNPSYVRGMTHPAKECLIRLPLGMEQSAVDALKQLSPIEFPFKYTVVKGDSLWAISRRFGVSLKSLCEINDISENAILKIGKTLYIPSK
ncbi:MAG: transglycosylase SLT domain-containing protein [Treponema sp.]|nr:transglycosylase SLT domain-containing protein [Treponema sp.]